MNKEKSKFTELWEYRCMQAEMKQMLLELERRVSYIEEVLSNNKNTDISFGENAGDQ